MALPIYTHIPNLKGLTKIFFKLSRRNGNFCGGGVTILNPKYPRLSSGDTIKALFPKQEKSYPHNSTRMESEECGIFFNVPKIGNLHYMNTDQLQYINNHITAC